MTKLFETADLIERLLAIADEENAERPNEFRPAIARVRAAKMIQQVLDVYQCREGSAASVYAMDRLDQAVGWKPVKVDPPSELDGDE